MNNNFSLTKNNWLLLSVAAFVVALNYALLKQNGNMLTGCFMVIGILGIFYALAFAKNLLFPAVLFCIPFSSAFRSGGMSIDFPAEILVGLLSFVYIIRIILKPTIPKKILFHPVTILLFSELMWMLIASTNSNIPLVSIKRCLVRFAYLVVFYLVAAHWFADEKKRYRFSLLYAIGLIIPVLHTLYVHSTYNFNKATAYAMPQPFYADHTIYGAALAFILPALLILFYNRKMFGIKNGYAWGLFFLILLVVAGEIFSYSRAAWVSLAVTLLFYFLVKIRMRLWMLIVSLMITGMIIFAFRNELIESLKKNEAVSSSGTLIEHVESVTNLQTDASNMERINRWMCAIRMSEEKPILGFGPGMYQFEYGRFQVGPEMTRISTYRGNRGHAHSEFFNALSETGIPGLIITIVMMFTFIGYGLRVIYKSINKKEKVIALSALLGLVTFYVHGFFNAFMDSDKMVALIYGSIAMIVMIDIQQRKKLKVQTEILNANKFEE